MTGLIAASTESKTDSRISLIALFDNEEVGSVSAYGAESNFIEATIERVSVGLMKEAGSATETYQRCLAKSFLLSCDMVRSFLTFGLSLVTGFAFAQLKVCFRRVMLFIQDFWTSMRRTIVLILILDLRSRLMPSRGTQVLDKLHSC